MNKNIKKIVIFSIICTAFSTCIQSTICTGAQYAYAYSDDEITNLKLISGFNGIPLYSSISYKSEYKIKTGDTIPIIAYSRITSDKTNIKLDTIETKAADTRVFVGKENFKLDDIYSTINIAQGEKKIIYVRLYNSKNASDNDYTAEYELIVEREVNDDDNYLDNEPITIKQYDDIYLDKLILYDETQSNDQIIDYNFDKTQPISNLNVDGGISYIKIKAIPEQQSYKLRINDQEVDTHGDDKYEKYLYLDKGKNLVKIRIVDSSDRKIREYYLNIIRDVASIANNNSTNSTGSQNPEMQRLGSWQYKNADGTLATGWTYIGTDWYYFDSSGIMKTGWFQDTSGKWYYLKESGVMAKDTVINGYKIDSNGVCISK